MQNKGYTIPELIIVIVIVGLCAAVAINKASYAFVDTDAISEQTREMILIKCSTAYANSIKENLKQEEKIITGKDLVDAEYLVDDDKVYTNMKVKLSYNNENDTVLVELVK